MARHHKALFEYLKDKIPSSQWADTPLELKATAGLRLLKRMLYHCVAIIFDFLFMSFLAEQAEGILDGVRKLLKDSPFKGLFSKK